MRDAGREFGATEAVFGAVTVATAARLRALSRRRLPVLATLGGLATTDSDGVVVSVVGNSLRGAELFTAAVFVRARLLGSADPAAEEILGNVTVFLYNDAGSGEVATVAVRAAVLVPSACVLSCTELLCVDLVTAVPISTRG